MERLFDVIGKDYRSPRRADPRIVGRRIERLRLPAGALVADVGAGTGNYSNALAERGYTVVAIEPAMTMWRQAMAHPLVTWVAAVAEALPLVDASVDVVVAILSYHHFSNPAQALMESA